MDGFNNSQMVLVVGITNKIELVDETLLRSGRFDLKIKIETPDTIESIEIMKKYLANVNFFLNILIFDIFFKKNSKISEEKIIEIASRFKEVTGADIQKIINECSYLAYEKEKNFIEDQDLETSFKNFIIEKNNLLIQNISL